MRPRRKLNRRSFVRRVLGSSIAAGSAFALIGKAHAQVTDSDPGDPVGHGRGGGSSDSGSGVTDSDTGPGADPAGRGRGGGAARTGVTDSDTGAGADPAGGGRGGDRQTGDSDASDPVGNARYPDRRRYNNIDGSWIDSNGMTYEIVQTGDTFSMAARNGERAQGDVNLYNATGRWWGAPEGAMSVRGDFEEDRAGGVVAIRWSNGRVFTRYYAR